MKNKGVAVESIQNFLGHESFSATMDEYGTQSFDEMIEDLDKNLGLNLSDIF